MNNNSEHNHTDQEGRRPLKVRQIGLAHRAAKWLCENNITPNQISIASVGFAVLAAICFLLLPKLSSPEEFSAASWILPLLAALFIQARLLCNLFDGMVAVEGGRGTQSGELFNDIPDRIADPLILVAAGYSVISYDWAASIGWAAGLLAVMTAYVRTLASSIGVPVDFGGPMAKQHRMALMTLACVLSAMQAWLWSSDLSLTVALVIVIAGCVVTIYRRTTRAYAYLETNSQKHEV